MDSVKLEKQMRIVPLICFLLILFLRQLDDTADNTIKMIVSIGLGILAIVAFIFKMYLEKKNGHFVAKRYYIFYFFILISLAMFLYQMMNI